MAQLQYCLKVSLSASQGYTMRELCLISEKGEYVRLTLRNYVQAPASPLRHNL
jgi:hypothetical protein